ncbi:hypothetical protein BKA81DRAFT_372330 [Phyllosticta paracitricarpa]
MAHHTYMHTYNTIQYYTVHSTAHLDPNPDSYPDPEPDHDHDHDHDRDHDLPGQPNRLRESPTFFVHLFNSTRQIAITNLLCSPLRRPALPSASSVHVPCSENRPTPPWRRQTLPFCPQRPTVAVSRRPSTQPCLTSATDQLSCPPWSPESTMKRLSPLFAVAVMQPHSSGRHAQRCLAASSRPLRECGGLALV